MKQSELLKKLQRIPKKILSVSDLQKITGESLGVLRVTLNRLTKSGLILRISKGYYANPFYPPSLEEISCFIVRPSYISLESALYKHNIFRCVPLALTCIAVTSSSRHITPFGEIEYNRIRREMFFGYEIHSDANGKYWLATPEKALLDLLYLRPVDYVKGILPELDFQSLSKEKFLQLLKDFLNSFKKIPRKLDSLIAEIDLK